MPRRVAIVGGGITGLAAAFELERTSDAEIDLYEASPRLGGKLRTDRLGDLLVEGGPDCFFSRKPGVMELVRALGIEDRLVDPVATQFGMLVDGALHLVPRGLVNLGSLSAAAIRDSTMLSDEGKSRALAPEPVPTSGDLSIRAFFSQRYGPEFSRIVAEPLLAGTHGGNADRLSMRALYPNYLEPSSGPGGGGDLPVKAGAAAERPTFLSFDGGMQTLVDALAASLLRTRTHLNSPLAALPHADRTLVAIPANRAVRLLPDAGLDRIAHRSSVIATLAFRREQIGHPMDGTGFLVPAGEPFPLTGATWSSQKWPGRAPADTILMRGFLREEREFLPGLKELLSIDGEPLFSRLDQWDDALPQYELGHLDLVAGIEARLPEGVFLAGTSYRGVGVPDCLRQGREAARRLMETL